MEKRPVKSKRGFYPCPNGHTGVCNCYWGDDDAPEDDGMHWRVHCQDCEWEYGGSSLTPTNQDVIDGWNSWVDNVWGKDQV